MNDGPGGARDQMMERGAGHGGGGGGGFEHGMHGGMSWLMGISLTLITISLIIIAVLAILAFVTKHRGGSDAGSAEAQAAKATAVLDNRLAMGEIGIDDYTRRRAALTPGAQGDQQPTAAS